MQHVVSLLLAVVLAGGASLTLDDDQRESETWGHSSSVMFSDRGVVSPGDSAEDWRKPSPVHGPRKPRAHQWPTRIERWRPVISLYFDPSDVELALKVIACESAGDPKAVNKRSQASGLWQHLPGYWEVRTRQADVVGASIWDPKASTIVASWLVYNTANSWDYWSCARHMDW